jgi:alanine dehydrogenase
VPARATDTAAEAVRERDVVILATTSPVPVLDAADLAPGTHVNAVGFKQRGRAEFGPDLPAAAALIATDSPAQADAYDPPMVVPAARMRHLGAIVAGDLPGRLDLPGLDLPGRLDRPGRLGRDEITLFCSVGLAGTEVFLLDRIATTTTAPVRD